MNKQKLLYLIPLGLFITGLCMGGYKVLLIVIGWLVFAALKIYEETRDYQQEG